MTKQLVGNSHIALTSDQEKALKAFIEWLAQPDKTIPFVLLIFGEVTDKQKKKRSGATTEPESFPSLTVRRC